MRPGFCVSAGRVYPTPSLHLLSLCLFLRCRYNCSLLFILLLLLPLHLNIVYILLQLSSLALAMVLQTLEQVDNTVESEVQCIVSAGWIGGGGGVFGGRGVCYEVH